MCGENCFFAIGTYTCLLCAIEKYMFSMPLVLIFSFLAAIAVRCRENCPLLPPACPPRNVRAHIAASDPFRARSFQLNPGPEE